jgi:hypothetical protein
VVVPIDDHVVLLAAGTPEVAAPVADRLAPGDAPLPKFPTSSLLPPESDWRLALNPQGHSRWMKRQMDAVLGPVIGGPMIREFLSAAPITAAGGFRPQEFWADIAVPAETLSASAQYLHR